MTAAALLALAVLASAAAPVRHARYVRSPLAVVEALTPLAGAGIELDPGQVVRVVRRDGERVRVRAGRGVEGEVGAEALREVWGGEP